MVFLVALVNLGKKLMHRQKVSVCMATYNGQEYLKEQIFSILTQLSEIDELVVSDDGSTDDTLTIISSLKDPRIKIITNAMDKGYSGNFENALLNATGEIIFLSDQDDVWLDGRVKKMCDALQTFDLVVSDAQFVDKCLHVTNETFFALRGGKVGFLNNLYKSRYLGACMAFRRSILEKLLPFPTFRGLCPHDLWITLVAEFYFKVAVIREPLILYRRHDNNVSNGGVSGNRRILWKLSFRIYSVLMVASRVFK